MSSSRDQTTFTGAPAALEASTASTTKSCMTRRPNPPPRNVVFTATFDGSSPAIRAATSCTPPPRAGPHWYWVGTQTVHLSASTCAVAFIGSMQAWARYGASYTALSSLPPLVSAAVPVFFATKPGPRLLRHDAGPRDRRRHIAPHALGGEPRRGTLVPDDLQGFPPLVRRPVPARQHRHPRRQLEDLLDAGHLLRRGLVPALRRAAEDRTPRHHGHE